MKRWDRYRVALALFMEDFDVLVCPVDPLIYTCVFSLVGWPCAVVRCGAETNGLPIGVQVVGKPWRDNVVLAAAAEIERSAGGWRAPLM
jgi:amidase